MTRGSTIFYTVSPTLHRMARMENGVIQELDFEIPDKPASLLGGIYLGKVVEIQKPLKAAFVDIGEPQPGWLPIKEDKLALVTQGEKVLVQVKRTENPLETKGVRLTRLITLSLGSLLYTPFKPGLSFSKTIKDRNAFQLDLKEDEGLIVRSGATPDNPLAHDLAQLRDEWERIQQQLDAKPSVCISPSLNLLTRILRSMGPREQLMIDDRALCLHTKGQGTFTKEKAFDEVCEDAWDSLSSIEVSLPKGGNLTIEETRGLVVIDVNTEGALHHPLPFNRMAIQETLRQIQLRELGGKIVIDLVGGPHQLPPLLQGIRVPSDVQIFGLSPLGLLEIIRKRRRLSLPQRLKLHLN